MNFEQARNNMINQQIRAWHVLNDDILNCLAEIPREHFVPKQFQQLAFADINIPFGHNQVMMTPQTEARLLQALDLQETDKVLEVGTGTGYLTALMANQASHVYSVDIFPEFTAYAGNKLASLGINNVTLATDNAGAGWKQNAPYDVIAITGSLPTLPVSFRKELNMQGRLFAILGQEHSMEATLIYRQGEDRWQQKDLFETEIPPLVKLVDSDKFKF